MANIKQIQTVRSSTHKVDIKFHRDLSEYVCKLYKVVGYEFRHVKGADYFTDDKQDAIGTAAVMLRDAK